MTSELTPKLRKFVEDKVKTGQFASAAEVIRGALTLLQAEEGLTTADVEALRREVEVGLKQADRGQFVEFTAADIKARGHGSRNLRRNFKRRGRSR